MNMYTAAIEALDAKGGRALTVDDWRRAGDKSEHTPATLTEDDIVILGYFGGQKSAEHARTRGAGPRRHRHRPRSLRRRHQSTR